MDTNHLKDLELQQESLSKDTLNKLQKRNKDALSRELDKTHHALVMQPALEKARVPEPVFKDHFLPYFSGTLSVNDNADVIPMWIGIAGSPSAEVSVVDATGNVLYDVPAIMDLTIINAAKHKLGESLAEIYNQYDLHSSQLPVVGERFLADAIQKKTPTMFKPSEKFTENTNRWNQIFDRYDLKHSPTSNKAEPKTKIEGDLDLDYD